MAKPILKWAGGKRTLIPHIKSLMPSYYNNYCELFLGGGSLFFNLEPEKSILCDSNKELINFYRVVRDEPLNLLKSFDNHKNTKDYYLNIRSKDRCDKWLSNATNLEKASRFCYLNKNSFNGLYRVNKSNQFNVPYGNYSSLDLPSEQELIRCSALLKESEIYDQDFYSILSLIKEKDFVYLDPPYIPLNKTSSFTGYTPSGFSIADHRRIASFCKELDSKGVFIMLSNSDCEATRQIYSFLNINEIYASRSINSKSTGRGKVKELILTNYQ